MTSLSAEAVIYREGLISVRKNIDPRYSSSFTDDRKIKREDIILSSEQKAGITSVLVGEDNIVCLPTGCGKSIEIYRIDSKSSLWCHSLRSEHTCAENPKEEACIIDRIASETAVRTLDFIRLKEGLPSCTICGRIIPRCELIAIRARPSSALSAHGACAETG